MIKSIKKIKNNKIVRILANIIKVPFYLILLLVIVYNITIISQKIINPDKIPNFLGYKNFIIKSGSMMPSINIGDIIVIKVVSEDELKIGDVVSYKTKNNFVTHRIIEIKDGVKKSFITKGDYNNSPDRVELFYENIEGRVEVVIPKVGNFIIFLQNRTVLVSLIVVMGVIIYLKYSGNDYSEEELENKKKKKEKNVNQKKIKNEEEIEEIELL